MGSKNQGRARGRPRQYDPETALMSAMEAFWASGYSATSLDDLCAATGMTRPSLYAAFGDKRSIYLRAADKYRSMFREMMLPSLDDDLPLRAALSNLVYGALDIYLPTLSVGRGCFLIASAQAETLNDPDIQDVLAEHIEEMESAIERRLESAKSAGELISGVSSRVLAAILANHMTAIAVRVRAGYPKPAVDELAAAAIDAICTGGKEPRAIMLAHTY